MRSLVPILSLAMVSFAATALASPPPEDSAATPKSASTMMAGEAMPKAGANAKLRAESAMQQRLRKQVSKEVAQAMQRSKSTASGCFTLKVYAPADKPHARDLAGIERRYSPRPFVLRSTCSSGGQVMALSFVPAANTEGRPQK